MSIQSLFTQGTDRLRRFPRMLANFREWIWAFPEQGEGRWLQLLRAAIRIHIIFYREFQRDQITLRASALTFTIVLSLVPTLALGTAVLKGLGAGDQARQAAYRLIDQLEIQNSMGSVATEPAGADVAPAETEPPPPTPEAAAAKPENTELTAHLRRATDQIFDYVDRTDFAKLGAFGILGLVIAVVLVMDSIEASMNSIWMAQSERPIGRKVMDYLALMILLPVTINLALAMEATLQSPKLLAKVEHLLPMPGIENFILMLLPLFLVVATFCTLYRFLPNAQVKLLPSVAGALFGGVVWLATQALYVKLQIGVARYNAIYGSFATLPLFLLWMQLGWIIFLSGAEMAFAVQFWRQYNPVESHLTPLARLTLAFNIVNHILADFKERKITSRTSLAEAIKQPETSVNSVLHELIQGGILRKVQDKKEGYTPASPEETIQPAEIVDLILGTEAPHLDGDALALEALAAARQALADKRITGESLRDLKSPSPKI